MKKYKLIKEYPDSPKLGTITKVSNKNIPVWYNVGNWEEFWQEIVDKDYEILELACKNHNDTYILHENGLYGFKGEDGHGVLEHVIKYFPIIKSVKRLSDGEIFTVGDSVINVSNNLTTKIKSFSTEPYCKTLGELCALYEDGDFNYFYDVIKFKEVLFTTEDGVDIFEHKNLFFVKNFNFIQGTCHSDSAFYHDNKKYIKLFSSKEAAEKYIILNKPCLSINDCLKIKYERNLFNTSS